MYLSGYINKNEYTTISNITNDLYLLKYYIIHAPIDMQFITSDNQWFTIVGCQVLSLGGFGDIFTFLLPLCPTACLYLNSNQKEEKKF
jgi:hypothetical protein